MFFANYRVAAEEEDEAEEAQYLLRRVNVIALILYIYIVFFVRILGDCLDAFFI